MCHAYQPHFLYTIHTHTFVSNVKQSLKLDLGPLVAFPIDPSASHLTFMHLLESRVWSGCQALLLICTAHGTACAGRVPHNSGV